jgi:hypothetical protein
MTGYIIFNKGVIEMTEQEWIKNQGKCCFPDCDNVPTYADNLDNVYCDECAEQNMAEEPENWD